MILNSSQRLLSLAAVLLVFPADIQGFHVPSTAIIRTTNPLLSPTSRCSRSLPVPVPPSTLHKDFSCLYSTKAPLIQVENSSSSSSNTPPVKQQANNLLQKLQQNKRRTALTVLALAICSLGFTKRQALFHLLAAIDLSGVNQWLRTSLDRLRQAGTAGVALYAGLFCLWTMLVGVTTPIETAAGFAFGAKVAVVANSMGKLTGAMASFFLGRFIFYEFVRKKLQDNEILQLVEESLEENPLLVAIMMRFSPLPEQVKNLGMSVLSVKSRYYVLSVLLHGLPFTCLWSCMGAETAKVVTLGAEPSKMLKILVSGSTWFGAILSPSLIGWWLNSLRSKRAKRQAQSGNSCDADS